MKKFTFLFTATFLYLLNVLLNFYLVISRSDISISDNSFYFIPNLLFWFAIFILAVVIFFVPAVKTINRRALFVSFVVTFVYGLYFFLSPIIEIFIFGDAGSPPSWYYSVKMITGLYLALNLVIQYLI